MTVQRVGEAVRGHAHGVTTLTQVFRFDGATADRIVTTLTTAPLVGDRSLFGSAGGAQQSEAVRADGLTERTMHGYSPVPGFRFDVGLRQVEPRTLVVRFSQPASSRPYLTGELAWFLSDAGEGEPGNGPYALWDEQINTPRALQVVDTVLTGRSPSVRRDLFFRTGHVRVMDQLTRNVAALL